MDLGQQSNLGSLISAVLVGLLALASNQYARMDRAAMRSFLNDLQARRHVIKAAAAEVDQAELRVKDIEAQIEKLDAQLSEIFEKWKQGRIRSTDRRLKPIWQEIEELRSRLEEDADLRDTLSPPSHVNFVWILFQAAEMNPQQFSRSFLVLSEKMLNQDNRTVGVQAAVLRIYHGYDRANPNEAQLTEKLESFVREHPEEEIGVFLYLIVTRELYEAGHRELSERILQRGIRLYADFPGDIGRIRLLNELIDQRMGK